MQKKQSGFVPFLRIENYERLIAGLALKHWKRLPPSTKSWIDVEDFINDGMMFARFNVLPYYKIKTAAFSTILQIMLDQYFMRQVESFRRQKRTPVELPTTNLQTTFDSVLAHHSLVELYWAASPKLRTYVYEWFFSGDGVDRLPKTGSVVFKRAKKEFRKLADKYGVTAHTCQAMFERRQSVFVDNERIFDDEAM